MSMNDDRIIRFSGLKPGVYTYGFRLDDEFFATCENEEIRGGKVEFGVKMERMERMLLFTFSFSGELTTWCDRCLGDMTVGVTGEESLSVRFSDSETSTDEETVILPESATEIDLTPWMYEYVAVRMPLKHAHSEEDCDPAVTRYLVDEEQKHDENYIDPRWDALKDLK